MFKVDFFTFNPVEENTYLLSNETNECIIIDPGCYFIAEFDTFYYHISNNRFKPVKLFNTHCHFDHVFGNKNIAEKYKLELYIHSGEQEMLKRAPEDGLMYGLSFDNYKGKLQFLKDGDIVKLGNDELKVILAPGHSPASICFYCAAQSFLIGGDLLFRESIGRTDLPGSDYETLIKSIREKLFTLPDQTVIYPGHGTHTTIGHEKKYNPFLREI